MNISHSNNDDSIHKGRELKEVIAMEKDEKKKAILGRFAGHDKVVEETDDFWRIETTTPVPMGLRVDKKTGESQMIWHGDPNSTDDPN